MKLPPFILLFFLLFAGMQCSASARTLAVFPLLDLTQDESGANLPLTEYLSKEAVEKGFTVLPEDEVMDFLVRHRIRSLGALTSYQRDWLRAELNPDFVLLGTVCQLGEKPAIKVSLSLQLIRTSDGVVVWSTIRDLHEADEISLLALSDPTSLDDLFERYFRTIFDTIPDDIKTGDETPLALGILSVNLQPEYVKPGQKIDAEVKVYYSDSETTAPNCNFRIAGKEYPVEEDGEARLLKSSWLAQEEEGIYPVDLVCNFASDHQQVHRLGEYTVDGIAPEILVTYLATTIEGEVYFNKDLSILTRLKVPEVLSRWEISVFDKERQLLLLHDGSGQVPERVIWNGMLSGTEVAEDGRYTVQVQVWDRAENTANYEGHVNLMRTKPKLAVVVERKDADVHVQLDNEVQTPLAFWFLKVYEKNGGMLASRVGETLPATFDFKLKRPDSNEPLEMFFVARDQYGNRMQQKVDDLLNLDREEEEKEIVQESQWLENF